LRSKIVAGVAIAISLACASPEKTKASQAAVVKASDSKLGNAPVASKDQQKNTKDVVCTFEERVGTHMREKVCRYQEDIDSQRVETQEILRRQRVVQEGKGN